MNKACVRGIKYHGQSPCAKFDFISLLQADGILEALPLLVTQTYGTTVNTHSQELPLL